jgi:RNA polymerase sigma-70 factor (ECF subfamily)
LFKIAYHKTISFLRKKNPPRAAGITDENGLSEPGRFSVSLVDYQTPARKMEEQEAEFLLYAAIDRLPEMQKKVLLMHKFEDYSHKEIGEMMHLSVVSVESLIYREKVSLRKSLYSYFKKHFK